MRITRVEILESREPLPLPEPWNPAWSSPGGETTTAFAFSFYKVYTDEGIVGYGPETGSRDPGCLLGRDPFMIEAFWEEQMAGRRAHNRNRGASGLEIALWDIVGKAAGLPVYKLLGAHAERIPVYAATSRLMPPDVLADHVAGIVDLGFKAVKLRAHRAAPWEDVAAVEAVRDALGDDLTILVDANQYNASPGYRYWPKRTAWQVARALEALDVYYLEEPLPGIDLAGLAEMAAEMDMFIAGGELALTVYDLNDALQAGAYDIIQPDVTMGGNYGITGVLKAATLADYAGRLIIPHTPSGRTFPLGVPATLHAMATVANCPMVEFPFDPPILTAETTQAPVVEPLWIDADGCVPVPDGPGLGVTLHERMLKVAWAAELSAC
jgi:D-galactarolactone cycloisomerase